MVNSRNKGARAEVELGHVLSELLGVGARRGQQYSGLEGEDVVGWEGVHVECKRVERLNVVDALNQAVRDAADGKVPVVCHRKNRTPWMVTLRLEDLKALAQTIT